MTENEKLRALLAEALGALKDHDDTLHKVTRWECWCCGLCRRIDAALAEPVGTVIDWPSFLIKTERERDEARAEVERLRVEIARLHEDVRSTNDAFDFVNARMDRRVVEARNLARKEARVETTKAFERGAEAMREAVTRQISVLEDSRSNIILALAASGERASDKIMVEHDCLRDVLDLIARTTTPKDKP